MQAISPPVQQFIERMGFLMERLGAAKTLGRMMGLLLVATRPLSLDDLSSLLLVSKASISTNARVCENAGFVQRVGIPGDRRTYFEILPGSFGRILEARNAIIGEFEKLAAEGIDAISPENEEARVRLEGMRDFYAFVGKGMDEMIAAWKAESAQ
jgi:DNA-binding transcriptional regulator GbsR (MarR family)